MKSEPIKEFLKADESKVTRKRREKTLIPAQNFIVNELMKIKTYLYNV